MKPLTLEELRKMDGKPVWVKYMGEITCPSQWCIVNARMGKVGNTDYEFPFEDIPDDEYGRTWVAYNDKEVDFETGLENIVGDYDLDRLKELIAACKGLEPKEIAESKLLIATRKDPDKLARMAELVQADKEGRILIIQDAEFSDEATFNFVNSLLEDLKSGKTE